MTKESRKEQALKALEAMADQTPEQLIEKMQRLLGTSFAPVSDNTQDAYSYIVTFNDTLGWYVWELNETEDTSTGRKWTARNMEDAAYLANILNGEEN
jgi:hypothetical protein